MPVLDYIVVAGAAYLLGSIPTGFLVARAKGIDIRTVGSGNIGATNAMRVLGKPVGIFVLLMDCAKGYVACALIPPLVWNWYSWYSHWLKNYFLGILDSGIFEFFQDKSPEDQMRYCLIAGIFAVLGHNYTCWLKFKGGKGVATSAGVYLALAPLALGIALAVFILTILATRYVSLGAIMAAVALPLAVYFTQGNDTLNIVTLTLGVMAILRHKSNIQRLMAGTENRLGKKPEGVK